jgi:hypothetical protein
MKELNDEAKILKAVSHSVRLCNLFRIGGTPREIQSNAK